ncbi:MAG: DUF3772 domain-containing protein [Hyphomicrobiaceae bacterium]
MAQSVEQAEKSIQKVKELEGELGRVRSEVERVIYESTATAENLRPQLEQVRDQIKKLGPPPAKDQPPESATVAAERQRLNALGAALDGAVKTAELAWVRAKQLIDRITVMRYQMFARNLLERRDSPILPGVWRDVAERMDAVVGRLQYYGGDWLIWAKRSGTQLVTMLAGLTVLYGLLRLGVGRIVSRALVRPAQPPSFFARVLQASWLVPLRALPLAICASLAIVGLDSLDLLFEPWDGPGYAMYKGLLVLSLACALLATLLAPRHPAWRVIPLADVAARRVRIVLTGFVAVYVLDTVLVEFGRVLYVPLPITIAQTFLISLGFFVLLLWLLLTPFTPQSGADRPVNGDVHEDRTAGLLDPVSVKFPLWIVAITIVVSSMLGYVSLGRFVAHQLVLSGVVLAAAGLMYLAVRAATRGTGDGDSLVDGFLGARFGLEGTRRRQISRLMEFVATILIALTAMPALLVQWGFSRDDIRDWLLALLFGFEIGQFRISLVRILIGIGLFIGLLFVTRVVQRWLRDSVLDQSRIDAGISNSIETAVGYSGTGLALLLALSYAGLDITSLAIVAGALSVGIGFGLQSIVNNFVSGLILLVERPVKVGDWIVVGTEQGNVRRISVRSTEIETFDRASLIIPNSELITGRVMNWTHRNQLGRAVVKITAAPDADPEHVLKVLRAAAASHPEAMQQPGPVVTFDNFATTGLEFTVRVTVQDVYRTGPVATDLRVAILKILREEGLSFGHPQYDVHLRDLDSVRALFNRLAAQRAEQEAAAAAARDVTPAEGVPKG